MKKHPPTPITHRILHIALVILLLVVFAILLVPAAREALGF